MTGEGFGGAAQAALAAQGNRGATKVQQLGGTLQDERVRGFEWEEEVGHTHLQKCQELSQGVG